MRCLTVRNPWAWAIIHAGKSVENRQRRTAHRGPLLIHAGLKVEPLDVYPSGLIVPADARTGPGTIIGVVAVVDCVPLAEMNGNPWASGPWCWILANPRPLTPIPWVGMPGLFDVPDELVR